MTKTRIDLLLVERGLADSRTQAQALIMAGQVRADGQVVLKSSTSFDRDVSLGVERGPRFVSRGGEKLEAALQSFQLNIEGQICADVGASTGGFTDCMLQRGAARVYAIDVGKGILHWKLRSDPRVMIMEETNARYVKSLPEIPALVTIDASFISLKILLPVVLGWFRPASDHPGRGGIGNGEVIALIKPQFEAGKKDVSRGDGVIRDREIHQRVLMDVLTFAGQGGIRVANLIKSPLLGPKGNTEFLARLQTSSSEKDQDLRQQVEHALAMPPNSHV